MHITVIKINFKVFSIFLPESYLFFKVQLPGLSQVIYHGPYIGNKLKGYTQIYGKFYELTLPFSQMKSGC